MKDFIVIRYLTVILVITLLSCSTTNKAGSAGQPNIAWQVRPIIIDGDNEDWSMPYQFMDDKAKIQYSFSNDKDNLYISVKTSDRFTQMKILNAGMRVWIDKEGKKNQSTSIAFPLENTQPISLGSTKGSENPTDQKDASSKRLKQLILGARDFSLQGFNNCNGGYLVSQKNNCDIQAKIGVNADEELIWEAVVPFKSFYKAALDKEDLGKSLSVCFDINALKKPEMPSGASDRGGRMGGPGGGGMGMPPSGGMPPGGNMPDGGRPGMGGNMEDMMKSFEATTTWSKIRLSYNGE